MAIRYDKSLNKEINRVVKNFNQKVKRLEKSERDLIIPETISVSDIKSSSKTRRELYRELDKLRMYSKRGMEETIKTLGGSELSRYEFENLKREARRVKANLTRQITMKKTTKPTVFGKVQDVTFAEMGESAFLNLVARRKALSKNINKLNKSELSRYRNLIDKTLKKNSYDFNNLQYNWGNEMLMPLAYMVDYPMDKLEEIVQKIGSLKEKDFINLFNNEMIMKAITEFYAEARSGNTKISADVRDILDELVSNIDNILSSYE